jgi:hypothetical protein
METIADFEKWIEIMSCELGQQVIAVKKLALAFSEGNIQLVRHDQVIRLRILKSRIMREVEDIKRMESAAQSGSIKGVWFESGAKFVISSLLAASSGRDPLDTGMGMVESVLSKKVPYGTILIAIHEKGLPDDLKIVPVSRFARESNKTESEVETDWKHDGSLLMTPRQFAELLDKVESGILDGSYSLPVGIDRLSLLIP